MPKTTLAAQGNSSSKFMKALVAAEGKVGKTTFLAASILGALPGQEGGLVDKPENFHLIGFDEAFADGLLNFLVKTCGRPDLATLSIWPFTKEIREASRGKGWDMSVGSGVVRDLLAIQAEVKKGGVHAQLFSSLTGLALGVEAGLAGEPDPNKKGAGMDQSKWGSFGHQMNHIRNVAQTDILHTFWEGHITKTSGEKEEDRKDTISVSGKVGQNWGFNVEQVFRLRREAAKYPGTAIDKVFMETRPTLDFVSGGRGFNEALLPREYDIVAVAKKLGKTIGGYRAPAKAAVVTPPQG
ncbi:dnaB-like helicase c terminal domain [Caudoviricetes sp.]|nr:dnaB-like helicase c terminal domain [Caudoviricetes sp.]UOF81865.1 dnaB-like helicase c terminal domain [Caudoviricetes sp.]